MLLYNSEDYIGGKTIKYSIGYFKNMAYTEDNLKIITSINHETTEQDLLDYLNLGMDEFYFGFMPMPWINRYGWEVCTNRRPYPVLPHITNLRQAMRFIKVAHYYRKNIYLAVNEHTYSKEQYDLLIPMIKKFGEAGIDGIMLADVALIAYLKYHNINIPIHLSVGGGVYNIETISFFNKLGIKRFILPRQLYIREIKDILTKTQKCCEFEIFLIGEWCKYDDAYCFASHGYKKDDLCKLQLAKKSSSSVNNLLLNERVPFGWCGMCILKELKRYYDRIIFKIPVRSDIFKQERLISKTIEILRGGKFKREIMQKTLNCNRKFCAYEIN